jgi:hypothetical protein
VADAAMGDLDFHLQRAERAGVVAEGFEAALGDRGGVRLNGHRWKARWRRLLIVAKKLSGASYARLFEQMMGGMLTFRAATRISGLQNHSRQSMYPNALIPLIWKLQVRRVLPWRIDV